jgi:hypothetical protein
MLSLFVINLDTIEYIKTAFASNKIRRDASGVCTVQYLPMCNKNLAAPQRQFETSIFPLKKPTSLIFIFRRLAGSSGTKLIGLHKLSA